MKLIPILSLSLLLTGCKFFGADPAPPSKAETYLFDILTNYTPRVVLATNVVYQTNAIAVFTTNQIGQIVLATNFIPLPVYNLVTITQQIPEYVWTPKTNTVQYTQTAGSVANMVAPGSGGLVTGLLGAGLLAWGRLRSSKKTNVALAQNVETALEFIETVPGGNKYTSAIKQFMQKDQAEQGVEKGVKAARAEVDNLKAKASVGAIDATIKNFSGVDRTKATG